jgi:hypothetical protein
MTKPLSRIFTNELIISACKRLWCKVAEARGPSFRTRALRRFDRGGINANRWSLGLASSDGQVPK